MFSLIPCICIIKKKHKYNNDVRVEMKMLSMRVELFVYGLLYSALWVKKLVYNNDT